MRKPSERYWSRCRTVLYARMTGKTLKQAGELVNVGPAMAAIMERMILSGELDVPQGMYNRKQLRMMYEQR